MNTFKITLAAIALSFGASAAQAATSDPRGPVVTERSATAAPQIVETRKASDDRRLFGAMSRPTIFGHDAEDSRYVSSGKTVQVWGHKLDR